MQRGGARMGVRERGDLPFQQAMEAFAVDGGGTLDE
jgi:hypothetical protein